MKKYKIEVKGVTWFLFKEKTSGWITVKYGRSGSLSRTQIRAIDLESSLQYIHSTWNGSIDPIRVEDLILIEEVQF